MLSFSAFHKEIPDIEKKINYVFKDKSLLTLAFVHRSYINENRDASGHNERLEFLGDVVLGLIISEYLYHRFPGTPEGDLSSFRSRLVDFEACAHYLELLSLGNYLLLGKGEILNGGRTRSSILSDLFEALVGAIFLDGGLVSVKAFLFGNFEKEFLKVLSDPKKNWKAALQDWCQKKYQEPPSYDLLEEKGPDHEKTFVVTVSIKGRLLSQGVGFSKKEAQQHAAKGALLKLGISI